MINLMTSLADSLEVSPVVALEVAFEGQRPLLVRPEFDSLNAEH